ncbi:unnamed protein product [Trichobilharzia regenti]|nr:unnamed protein product [Trichobilharzia regenti]
MRRLFVKKLNKLQNVSMKLMLNWRQLSVNWVKQKLNDMNLLVQLKNKS